MTGGLLAGFAPGRQVAGYLLEEQIGAGGMAVVFRAVDRRLGRPVALKILAPALVHDRAFRERFVRESRSAAAVDDPHIIPVYEAGEADGVLFIAMRLVPGRDARTLLHEEGPLPAERVAAIISPVASALDAAHAAGLVHRDVKPANILVDARRGRPDHVYLSDFGLSKGALATAGLTGTGMFLGTPSYSAPEQIQGQAVDGRADQYGLACAAFELLAGQPPFERDQGLAVIWAHLSESPPSVCSRRAGLPVGVDAVFATALAKDPASRYPACGIFAEELRAALGLMPYDSGPHAAPAHHPATQVAAQAFAGSHAYADPPPPGPHAGPRLRGSQTEATATSPRGYPGPRATPREAAPGEAAPGEADDDDRDVSAVAFAPGGDVIALGDSRGGVYLCQATSGRVLHDLTASLADPGQADNYVTETTYSPDGSLLAVGCSDGIVRLWDLRARRLAGALARRGSAGVNTVAFSPDGTRLAAGYESGTICLWNVRTEIEPAILAEPQSEGVLSAAFSPDGATLAAGDANGNAYLWDASSLRLIATMGNRDAGEVFGIAFTPDGTVLATGGGGGSIRLWDGDTGDQLAVLTRRGSGGASVFAVAFSPRSLHLAAAYSSGGTVVWDAERARPTLTLGRRHQPTYALAFSPDGTVLATGHPYGIATLWSLPKGRPTEIAINPGLSRVRDS